MHTVQTVYFHGVSGTKYDFQVFDVSVRRMFKNVPAIYAFLVKKSTGRFGVLYIGQSEELGNRLTNHNKWEMVQRKGCTHIGVMPLNKDKLDHVERDLIKYYLPPCNDQFVR